MEKKIYECGGYEMPVTSAEAVRGWIHCSACGRICKVRAKRDNTAYVRPHDRPKKGNAQ